MSCGFDANAGSRKMRNRPRFYRFSVRVFASRKIRQPNIQVCQRVRIPATSWPSGLRPAGIALATWLIGSAAAPAQEATGTVPQPDPTGEWMVAKKFARIKIADCGGSMWGVVGWESQPGGVDRKNPDPNLRNRPTLGMPILLGMTRSKVNQWDGEIYNSEDGHTYSASITLLNPSMLRVQGCFLGFLCGGENWTRVDPQDLPDNAQARVPQTPGNIQARPPQPPGNPQSRPGQSPSNRKAAVSTQQQPDAGDDVCLRLFGPTRLPHEGGLK